MQPPCMCEYYAACIFYCFNLTPYTDVRDGYDNTPLLRACMGGNKEFVQFLVEEMKCDVGEFVGGCITTCMYL